MGRSWLSGVDLALLHEVEERRDQVFAKVEVIVVHLGRHDERTRPAAPLVQLLRMSERDQVILHSVDQKGRASHFRYLF